MLTTTTRGVACGLMWFAVVGGQTLAQDENPQEQSVEAICGRSDFSSGDEERIQRWAQEEVDRFTAFNALRQRFQQRYNNAGNSDAFKKQLAKQTALVVRGTLANTDINPELAWSLIHVLLDMNRVETVPGLLAGLSSGRPAPRYLSARGLVTLRRSIVADQSLWQQTVPALRVAGSVETNPVALERIYAALAYPEKIADVFDDYIGIFEKRLTFRRQAGVPSDGAEIAAWEFFRSSGVVQALDAAQKTKLAGLIAVFLRLDAERYVRPDLAFDEMDKIERMLDGAEAVLTAINVSGGGNIRGALAASGSGNREAVLQEVKRWIGDASANQPGALSAAPWNVPVGAP